MTPGEREGHAEDLRSIVSSHDKQHHGPQPRRPGGTLLTCIDVPVGLPIEGFLWSEWGGHKIHRAGGVVVEGRAGRPPPCIRFRTVLLAAKGSSGGKHPNQQEERRKQTLDREEHALREQIAGVCARMHGTTKQSSIGGPRPHRSLSAEPCCARVFVSGGVVYLRNYLGT